MTQHHYEDDYRILVQQSYTDACAIRGVASYKWVSKESADSLHSIVKRDADELNALAAMIQHLPETLAWHTLASIECDHEAKTDVAICGCAKWRSDPAPNMGAATKAWVAHFMAELRATAVVENYR